MRKLPVALELAIEILLPTGRCPAQFVEPRAAREWRLKLWWAQQVERFPIFPFRRAAGYGFMAGSVAGSVVAAGPDVAPAATLRELPSTGCT
jgi:hypothetical protein